MGEYRVAEICENGHVITSNVATGKHEQFCSSCGKPTLGACRACETPIRGHFFGGRSLSAPEPYRAPSYCYKCGGPFPWTEARLKAANDLADEQDDLSLEDRDRLKEAIAELGHDSPGVEAVAVRAKKLLKKASGVGAEALRKIVVDFASETAKKILLG
jgi:hypothetical protein